MSSGYKRITKELDVKVLDTPETAVARTNRAMHTKWAADNGRLNQARAFLKRAKKSDQRRRQGKASRKKNRGR